MNRILVALCVVSLIGVSGCLFLAAGAGTAGIREYTDAAVIYRADSKACENAVRKTFKDIGAVVKETVREEDDKGEITLRGKTFDDVPMTVDIEPTTPSSTRIEIRVGRIGSKDRAEEVHMAIQKYLKPIKTND